MKYIYNKVYKFENTSKDKMILGFISLIPFRDIIQEI